MCVCIFDCVCCCCLLPLCVCVCVCVRARARARALYIIVTGWMCAIAVVTSPEFPLLPAPSPSPHPLPTPFSVPRCLAVSDRYSAGNPGRVRDFNLFTAAACKLSGLKSARSTKANYNFRAYNKFNFNAARFIKKNPFTC